MFCKNCGAPMDNNAVVCVKCGCQRGIGVNFCPNCGQQTAPGAAVCIHCGVALTYAAAPGYVNQAVPGQKSKMAAGLLGIFLGSLGIHNFYLGYTTKAVIQLVVTVVTLGIGAFAMGIWGLVEGIMILTGKIAVDGKGMPLGE